MNLKHLAIVGIVIAGTWPLAACFDGLSESVSSALGAGVDKVTDEIDQGLSGGDQLVQDKVDAWLEANGVTPGGGALTPIGGSCTADSQCVTNSCGNGHCQ